MSKKIEDSNDDEIYKLFQKMRSRSNNIEKYIEDVENMKDKLMHLFPEKLDFRSKFILEDKLKVTSAMYNTLLGLTQEHDRLIIKEIELRRSIKSKKGNDEVNIRDLIKKIESDDIKISYGTEDSEEEQIDE